MAVSGNLLSVVMAFLIGFASPGSGSENLPVGSGADSASGAAFADSLVTAAAPEGNWMLSPYSARMCLAMFTNGTDGKTREELMNALRISDLDGFNSYTKELMDEYEGYSKIMALDTANSVWLNQDYFDGNGSFLQSFSDVLDDYYNAEVGNVTSDDSIERVNGWVNEKTRGKIQSILGEDNRGFLTALVNAVYFKAPWEQEFYKSLTEPADFHSADGTTGSMDFMHITDYFGYCSGDGLQAVKLDYRNSSVDNEEGDNFQFYEGADFSMYLIKTDKVMNVAGFLNGAEFENSRVSVS
ncbi:MAG: hypothetical protein IK139_07945, partial [Lachnospiraceae bacterium]|nr:hypothetical protein [Lachnospiraceae bacterium]